MRHGHLQPLNPEPGTRNPLQRAVKGSCPVVIRCGGFTLIEVLVTVAIGALFAVALGGLINGALESSGEARARDALAREARFAMQRMVRAAQADGVRLLLPLADNPATTWHENLREETVPASPPETGSLKASAVLAVTLDPSADLDANGIPDADNDGDGRIDEDPPGDQTNDGAPGIYLIDDDGDGVVDENPAVTNDDDEDGVADEDPADGLDDDGDGGVDEDPGADLNGDGAPGILGVDDDQDGSVDEAALGDDDEDGVSDEDWIDPVVFHLSGGTLIQRTPVPWDEDGSGTIDGRDFVTSLLADQVTRLRVERVAGTNLRAPLIDLTLELTDAQGRSVSLHTRVRVGGGP